MVTTWTPITTATNSWGIVGEGLTYDDAFHIYDSTSLNYDGNVGVGWSLVSTATNIWTEV